MNEWMMNEWKKEGTNEWTNELQGKVGAKIVFDNKARAVLKALG